MDTTEGARLLARMNALGISKAEFSEHAKIDRSTLDRVLRDDAKVTDRTRGKVESALADLEHELGMAESGTGVVSTIEFRGAKVTMQGEPADVAEAVRLMLAD